MKIVKAVKITDTKDESLKILNAILPERRTAGVEVSPMKIARELGISEFKVRYNVQKFVELGYLEHVGRLYQPTKKVLFLNEN